MRSINFIGANVHYGAGQPEYDTLHAASFKDDHGQPVVVCFELTDEEVEQIVKHRRLYYTRLTFGSQCVKCNRIQPFQPMRIDTEFEGLEFIKIEE